MLCYLFCLQLLYMESCRRRNQYYHKGDERNFILLLLLLSLSLFFLKKLFFTCLFFISNSIRNFPTALVRGISVNEVIKIKRKITNWTNRTKEKRIRRNFLQFLHLVLLFHPSTFYYRPLWIFEKLLLQIFVVKLEPSTL